MAYNLGFIDPRDFLRDSQPGILENFAEIENFISEDHENFGTADEGKHKQFTLTAPQAVADFPQTLANERAIFQALSGITGVNQLFSKDSTNTSINFSDGNIVNRRNRTSWVSLPSGLVIKWTTRNRRTYRFPDQITETFNWGTGIADRPFNNQYWAAVIAGAGSTDSDIVFYVTDVSNAGQVSYSVWLRDIFSNQVTLPFTSNPSNALIIAIGD